MIRKLIFLIFLPFLGFWLGMKYSDYQLGKKKVPETITPRQVTPQCALNGFARKEHFLPSYRVKLGDTFSSIAKSELKDISRLDELLELNGQYQNYLIEDSRLTPGAVVFLPPSYLDPTNGQIAEFDGELAEKKDNGLWIIQTPNMTLEFQPDEKTKFFGQSSFETGDCVRVIFQQEDSSDLTVLTVLPQK